MNDETKPPAESDLTLPKALVEALRRVDAPGSAGLQTGPGTAFEAQLFAKAQAEMAATRPATPSAFFAQAQVNIAAARQADIIRLNARRRRMRFALWSAGSLLAAASMALVLMITLRSAPARPHTGDIRDAFSLARALRDGETLSAEDDFNRDGRVDGNDVRQLAMVAVALKGER